MTLESSTKISDSVKSKKINLCPKGTHSVKESTKTYTPDSCKLNSSGCKQFNTLKKSCDKCEDSEKFVLAKYENLGNYCTGLSDEDCFINNKCVNKLIEKEDGIFLIVIIVIIIIFAAAYYLAPF